MADDENILPDDSRAQEQECIYSIALSLLPRLSMADKKELYQQVGSATAIYEHRAHLPEMIDVNKDITRLLAPMDELVGRAQDEMAELTRRGVQVIPMSSTAYPQRLTSCVDTPVVIYYNGTTDLNHPRLISVVGTRRCTPYAYDIIRRLMSDIRSCTEVVVVSGLAYGVDILAHREAVTNHLPTIAVLAHGLEKIYPPEHIDTVRKMLHNGGVLTEYPLRTTVTKGNFVQRNRIVANMSDCTIVVESADHGGALITAEIAASYSKPVFAYPGPITAEYSRGCNNLIRDRKAQLITCAHDLLLEMGWADERGHDVSATGVQLDLFADLDDTQIAVVKLLREENDQQSSVLARKLNIPPYKMSSIIVNLEMKQRVRSLPGMKVHLL